MYMHAAELCEGEEDWGGVQFGLRAGPVEREMPRPAGKDAGLRDDSFLEE